MGLSGFCSASGKLLGWSYFFCFLYNEFPVSCLFFSSCFLGLFKPIGLTMFGLLGIVGFLGTIYFCSRLLQQVLDSILCSGFSCFACG